MEIMSMIDLVTVKKDLSLVPCKVRLVGTGVKGKGKGGGGWGWINQEWEIEHEEENAPRV